MLVVTMSWSNYVVILKLSLFQLVTSELLLSHVLFSNGEITPASYPGDIYANHQHFKRYSGSLTEKGQLSSYLLGQHLRSRYNDFLGNIYQTNVSEAFSIHTQASQESLQCFHLGLFPPHGQQKFAQHLDWQPVPYRVLKGSKDKFLSALEFCNQSRWNLPSDLNYSRLYEFVSLKTDHSVTTNEEIYNIYKSIIYQKNQNYDLPPWLEDNEDILNDLEFASTAFFKELIQHRMKIGVGKLLQEITNISLKKANTTLELTNRKLYIFSANIHNIMLVLSALSSFEVGDEHYEHSACVLFELHNLNGQVGFKMFYFHTKDVKLVELDIVDCGMFCLLKDFVAKTRNLFEPEAECF